VAKDPIDDPGIRWVRDLLGPRGERVARDIAEFKNSGRPATGRPKDRSMMAKLPADDIVVLVRVLWVSDLFARALFWSLEVYRGDVPSLFTAETHALYGNPVFSRGDVQLLRAKRQRLGDGIFAFNHRLLLVERAGKRYLEDKFFPDEVDQIWRGFEVVEGHGLVKWEELHEFLQGLRSGK